MAIVRRTKKEIREHLGRVDPVKLASFTEADIERFAREDDSDTSTLGEPRFIPPKTDVCALRGRLGLSQAEFAQRFFLSVRTVQQWERGAREPSEAARVFLYAISKDPAAIEHILHAT